MRLRLLFGEEEEQSRPGVEGGPGVLGGTPASWLRPLRGLQSWSVPGLNMGD